MRQITMIFGTWASLLLLMAILAVSSGVAAEAQTSQERVRDILSSKFILLTPAEREAYEARIVRALNVLPDDPAMLDKVIKHVEWVAGRSTQFLGRQDHFREAAKQDVRARALVLPDEFYRSAYDLGIQIMESDLNRITRRSAITQDTVSQIRTQIETLRQDAKAVLGEHVKNLSALEMASRMTDEIIGEFTVIISDPVYGYDRPLSEAEYAHVIEQFRGSVSDLPLIVIGSEKTEKRKGQGRFGEEHDDLPAPQTLVVDAREAKKTLKDALRSLYEYTRVSRSESSKLKNELKALESSAGEWMKDALLQHSLIVQEMMKSRASEILGGLGVTEESHKEEPKLHSPKDVEPAPRANKTPALTEGSPAPRSPERTAGDPEQKEGHEVIFGIILLAVAGIIVGFVLHSRRRTAGPPP